VPATQLCHSTVGADLLQRVDEPTGQQLILQTSSAPKNLDLYKDEKYKLIVLLQLTTTTLPFSGLTLLVG